MSFFDIGYIPSKPNTLVGTDGDGNYYHAFIDADGRQVNKNIVWDSDSLAWVAMTQPVISTDVINATVTFPATQTVDGTVNVGNFPAETGLTDTQLRNSAVPVSAVSMPLPSGASTAALQSTLESLVDTLQELIARMATIASWSSSGATGMRVVGVSMPSTAVTGPQTSAQYIAAQLTSRMAIENTNAVLSNINNCTGA